MIGPRLRARFISSGAYRFFVLLSVFLFFLACESVFARFPSVRFGFASLLCVFLALELPLLPGLALAMVVGYFSDVFSGEARGLHTFSAVFAFFLLRLLIVRFVQVRGGIVLLMGLLASAASLGVQLAGLWIFGGRRVSLGALWPGWALRLLAAFLLTYPLYGFLRRLNLRLKHQEEGVPGKAPGRPWGPGLS